MAERIALHRARRAGAGWETLEVPLDLAGTLRAAAAPETAILVDGLTLWPGNLFGAGRDAAADCALLGETVPRLHGTVLLVSKAAGLGTVPDNALARHQIGREARRDR